MHILAAFAAAAAALAALITPAHADGPLGAKGDTLSMPLADALAALPAAGENRAGYQRSAFKRSSQLVRTLARQGAVQA